VADWIDISVAQQEKTLQATLDTRQRLAGASSMHCVSLDCGEPIPAARRRALPGVQHCIDCAARLEKQQALKRK
jgi:phage/conjugal plasmid C-4 type zinc finger TraR family protein